MEKKAGQKKSLKPQALCPCDSRRTYGLCCRRFIEEDFLPATAEQLMRSRYTAYTQANMGYIQQTMIGKALENFDPRDAQAWALGVKWKKLKVLKAGNISKPNKAYVEFIATYQEKGEIQELHEKSEFLQQDGRWFYSGLIN
jgi:SEC-C motif domain protein